MSLSCFSALASCLLLCVLWSPFAEGSPGSRIRRSLQGTTLSCSSLQGDAVSSTQGLGGVVTVDIAPSNKLCTLVQLDNGFIKPVARSYDAFDWEASAGDFATINFTCTQTTCTTDSPLPQGTYQLTVFDAPSYQTQDIIARFLEQATFGPTRSLINALQTSFGASTFANWVKDQQDSAVVPISSHRERFRERVNARLESATTFGTVTHPCQAGTRYRNFAFSKRDLRKTLMIQTAQDGVTRELSIDGSLRTIVNGPVYHLDWAEDDDGDVLTPFADGLYPICYVEEEFVGGYMELSHPEHDCGAVAFGEFYFNPLVQLATTPENILNLDGKATSINDDFYAAWAENFDEELGIPSVQSLLVTSDLTDQACSTLSNTDDNPPTIFALYGGTYWIHDSRMSLVDNTVDSPLPDGGGAVAQATLTPDRPESSAYCSNVPRSFLNEEGCFMSTSPDVCPAGAVDSEGQGPEFYLALDHTTLRAFYEQSGRYVYAVDALRIEQDPADPPPCQFGSFSSWVPVTCGSSVGAPTITEETNRIFASLMGLLLEDSINEEVELNPNVRELEFFDEVACSAADAGKKGFEITDMEGNCWRNVHSDHLNIYDFTPWTVDHPGNSEERNPIKEFAEAGSTTLVFPDWHEMSRWQNNKGGFRLVGRLGGSFNYFDIPVQLRTPELEEALNVQLNESIVEFAGNPYLGHIVCGSPNEVASEATLGGDVGYYRTQGAFEIVTPSVSDTPESMFNLQKKIVWTDIALNSADQLRQRMAWALSQILVVSEGSVEESFVQTELFVTYYDIFVRNAFGSYRDILKEVSYSAVMADMLTYFQSRSTAYIWETEQSLEYADENYAREVMQLFSTGLVKLNMDGSSILDDNGVPLHAYSNDDIVEYARVWTGFDSQSQRGNIETEEFGNRIDPMKIVEDWRDYFPKMGLDRQYIGDGYPLCSDLPDQHFLKEGAIYRLLGSSSDPELLSDPLIWKTAESVQHLFLPSGGQLFSKLCGSSDADSCQFAAKVVLDENLSCSGIECNVESVRVIQVGDVFYEYTRLPCVHQAFYNDGKLVSHVYGDNYMCSDSRVACAAAACCDDDAELYQLSHQYYGERTTFSAAKGRCGQNLCDLYSFPDCEEEGPLAHNCFGGYFWTTGSCMVSAKIDSRGNVGIVHRLTDVESSEVKKLVQDDTKTFFRVDWSTDITDLKQANCGAAGGCSLSTDGMCICSISVTDEQVFTSTPQSPEEVLNQLTIGAFDPSVIGGFTSSTANGITIYQKNGGLNEETIFEVTDENGILHFRKNVKSTVTIVGSSISFRNPVHFIDLADPEVRDAHYETDAAIDHYFFHPNTAPFLALRFAQRFEISNPSPRFIETIATAFKTGQYTSPSGVSFGSGAYGDLGATIAAVLLDRESRNTVLDSDPAHGSLREPVTKILSTMRAMEFQLAETFPFVNFLNQMGSIVGQMAHEIPNVFSFFLPEFAPPGTVSQAKLVAPEAQVMTGPRIINMLNGLFSLIKFGLHPCFGGFGGFGTYLAEDFENCPWFEPGEYDESAGRLTFEPTNPDAPQQVIDELSTLLTAGRLSQSSRTILQSVYSDEDDESEGLRKAQLLLTTTPEFHSTNIARRSGENRPALQQPEASNRPYKALVYVLLDGGVDSYNMLAPHTCTQTNSEGLTLREQYNAERTNIAFTDEERTRIVDATGQPCSQFAIHPNLGLLESLYEASDLAFFANAGVINRPVTKEDYFDVTRTQLFAHNAMQEEAMRIDPFEGSPGTGVLGRMCDILADKGYNPKPITIEDGTVATIGVPGEAVDPLFVSSSGLTQFNPRPANDTFNPRPFMRDLNEATLSQSSLYGETWSTKLQQALFDNNLLLDALRDTELTQQFGQDDYSKKLQAISTLIASHQQRGTDRDVFYVSLGGWDHHENLKPNLAMEFNGLNTGLQYFTDEMKAQGLWENVTLLMVSDFARTLTSNSGSGSDHAWGGNYFMFGGSVKGGQIFGEYPPDITEAGSLNIGRGRLIPTMSWESILNGVVQWMGIETEEELDYCLPNRFQTGTTLYNALDLFEGAFTPAPTPARSPVPGGFCFSGDMTVVTEHQGAVSMKDLRIGDRIEVESGVFSEVYSFGHLNKDTEAPFVQLITADHTLELSEDHMVVLENARIIPAGSVRVGDRVKLASGSATPVVRIETVLRRGVYAPFTQHGFLAVNGIVASSYVSFEETGGSGGIDLGVSYHWLAHAWTGPRRWMCGWAVVDCADETYTEEGVATWVWVPYRMAVWWRGQHSVVRGLLLLPFLLLLLVGSVLEWTVTRVLKGLPHTVLGVVGPVSW